jgi:phosphatidylethanolamine-binding protein (PEBP) family uncharacterized protein
MAPASMLAVALQVPYFGPGAGPGPFHHYVFEFYALDIKLELPATANAGTVIGSNGRSRRR